MDIKQDVIAAIGNTPLIKLRKASELTGCTILGKAEFMNPGQSVKDRAALFIIRDAIARGELKPGGTIVEGTAGNTGIGLTVVANAHGLPHRDRHSRHPGPGEEGRAAPARRRARRGPGRPLQEPQQLREIFRPPRQGDGCGLGQPVRQHRQPHGPHRGHGARDLGADRRQGRWLRRGRRLRRHARRRLHGAEGPTPTSRSRWPTRWARRSTTTTSTAS